MELVCPAGNAEKLSYAYAYGADTAYFGMNGLSLRAKADNFYAKDAEIVKKIKAQFPKKRLFCALNIAFHEGDLDSFRRRLDEFKAYPIDAFIVQDLGLVRLLQKEFPSARLHLSTQASCTNSEAVKMYKDLGFDRVVLAREVSLNEIRRIKDAVPEMELECFAHGAMCIAYSGRCLLSAYLTARSAQAGLCTHACRWNFDVKADAKNLAESASLVLEESERKGEYFPVFEGENFTAILSSKDLKMIDHLEEMKKAGIDAIKIEGRMKSAYYVALVSRAYRKALDALEGKISKEEATPFVRSLDEVAHRKGTTGFYFSRAKANETSSGESDSPYLLAALVQNEIPQNEENAARNIGEEIVLSDAENLKKMHVEARKAEERNRAAHPEKNVQIAKRKEGWKAFHIRALNHVKSGTQIEIVSPSAPTQILLENDYDFVDPRSFALQNWINADHESALYTGKEIPPYSLIRVKTA